MNVLAKALYDNSAEAPDELEFRKGDVITVIEQNTGGLEGWWLCSLNGRQGIAPGNRLKIMAGMFETSTINTRLKKSAEFESYTYDTLPSRKAVDRGPPQDTYDVPPRRDAHPAAHLGYQTIPGARRQAKDALKGTTEGDTEKLSKINQKMVPSQDNFPQEIYDVPPSHSVTGPTEHYDTLPKHGAVEKTVSTPQIYNSLKKSKFGSPEKKGHIQSDGNGSPEKVISKAPQLKLPTGTSNLEIYDAPSAFKHQQEVYDIPPSHREHFQADESIGEVYDIPTQHQPFGGSLPNSPREKTDTNKKRIIAGGHKVVTKSFSQDVYDVPPHQLSHTKHGTDYTYDVPPQVSRDKPGDPGPTKGGTSVQDLEGKVSILSLGKSPRAASTEVGFPKGMLEIAREDAADTLTKKQQALDSSAAYLLSYVSSSWRKLDNLKPRIFEIRAACNQLKLASKEYLEFAEGTVANALQYHEAELFAKLSKLLDSLKKEYEGMEKTGSSMTDLNWEADKLCSRPENDNALLDSFVLSARSITDCAKRFCSVVQDNICALFKRTAVMQERPLPTPPSETGSLRGSTWVAAEKEGMVSKEPAQSVQVRPLPVPPQEPVENETLNTYEELPSTIETQEQPAKIADYGYLSKGNHIIPERQQVVLSEGDKQILQFYLDEVESLSNSITTAVELFFSSVEGNQPPKIFVSHSKHVIILGHKLVFIGDTIHHNIQNARIKERVVGANDILCDCLSSAVNGTKAAALQYPAVPPLQEMVDRITDVANATQDLRNVIMESGSH